MDTHRWLVLAMSAVWLWTSSNGEPDLQCLDCVDVVHPTMCSSSTLCQEHELCFTYKYTYSNTTRYRMGCQDKMVCDLVPVRPILVGRRGTAISLWKRNNMNVRSLCYSCCHSNNCNRRMCQGQGVTQKPTSTTPTANTAPASTETSTTMTLSTLPASTSTLTPTHQMTTTTSKTVCSSDYVGFDGSCYMLVYKSLQWDRAKTTCSQMGSHLVSVNSEREQQFLANLLITEGFPAPAVWIGGYFHPFWRRWTWVDGTDFQYQAWLSAFPLDEQHRTSISMLNLSGSSSVKAWQWRNEKPDMYFAFICEMKSSDA
ncbi:lithostathine-1-beta-like [Haliotis asinina]|uniref:lithostathine-1-beta-like n=1 Tax=Haliotis asinina TaxID=109174 RepID=UPI00353262CF